MKYPLLLSLFCLPVLCRAQAFSNFNMQDATIAFELAHVETPDGVWVAAVYRFVIGEGDRVSILRSLDQGVTWLEDTVYADVVDPAMCLDNNGDILLVLQHVTFGGSTLELHRSSDNGDHFTYFSALPADGFGDKPWLACDGEGHVYATWTSILFGSNTIGFTRSDDNGISWTETSYFVNATDPILTGSFLCIGNDDTIYMSWGESITGNIYFSRSTDFGVNWTEPVVVAEMPTKDFSPMTYMFASPAGNHLIILASIAHQNKELLYISSADNGASWTTTLLDTTAVNPAGIMQHNNAIHVVYTHFPGNYDTGFYSEMRYISRTPDTDFSAPIILQEGLADLLYSTYIGEYAQADIGSDTELHISWVRKTADIGFTHSIIDIPADTTLHEDTTTTATFDLEGQEWQLSPNPIRNQFHISPYVPNTPIFLYASDGRLVRSVSSVDGFFSVADLPKGMMFIVYQEKAHTCIVQ